MSDFVSFPLFWFTLVIKLRNLRDFKSPWNTLIFFYQKNDVRLGYVPPNNVWFGLSFVVWVGFDNKLRNTDFKLYWQFNIFQLRDLLSDQNLFQLFCVLFVFFDITLEIRHYFTLDFRYYELKEVLTILTYIEILYWKCCFWKCCYWKWLLSQNQHARNDFFGYRRY